MSNYIAIRDGGKTDEEGATRILNKLAGTYNSGRVGLTDFTPTEKGTPNMSVQLTAGDLIIPYQDYFFHGWSTATQYVTVNASDPSNGRIDRLVAYVDLTVVDSTNPNNPDALLFKAVAGTPSGSPAAINDAGVQSSVGAGNPWIEICRVAVGAGVTVINTANITDYRTKFVLGGSGSLPPFAVAGTLAVANNLTNYWIVPPGVISINRLDAVAKTGPTGASLNLRLYNVTQAHDVGSVSIAAGATVGSNTTMTNSSLTTADVIRFDCTQIGSTIAGADVTVQPSS